MPSASCFHWKHGRALHQTNMTCVRCTQRIVAFIYSTEDLITLLVNFIPVLFNVHSVCHPNQSVTDVMRVPVCLVSLSSLACPLSHRYFQLEFHVAYASKHLLLIGFFRAVDCPASSPIVRVRSNGNWNPEFLSFSLRSCKLFTWSCLFFLPC